MMPNKEGHKARKPDVAQVRNKVRHRTRTLVRVPVIGELLPGPGEHLELPDKYYSRCFTLSVQANPFRV